MENSFKTNHDSDWSKMSSTIHELCQQYNTKKGCKKGKKCPYIHHKVKNGEKVSIEYKTDQPKDWDKIENTPTTLNRYLHLLGYDGDCEFYDVFGLDEECLKMVPSDVFGVVCCMPVCTTVLFLPSYSLTRLILRKIKQVNS
jgi:hypothetical protein